MSALFKQKYGNYNFKHPNLVEMLFDDYGRVPTSVDGIKCDHKVIVSPTWKDRQMAIFLLSNSPNTWFTYMELSGYAGEKQRKFRHAIGNLLKRKLFRDTTEYVGNGSIAKLKWIGPVLTIPEVDEFSKLVSKSEKMDHPNKQNKIDFTNSRRPFETLLENVVWKISCYTDPASGLGKGVSINEMHKDFTNSPSSIRSEVYRCTTKSDLSKYIIKAKDSKGILRYGMTSAGRMHTLEDLLKMARSTFDDFREKESKPVLTTININAKVNADLRTGRSSIGAV